MIWIALIAWLGIISVRAIDIIEFRVFEFSNNSWSTLETSQNNSWVEISKKDTFDNNITYILITWRWGGTHDAPDLTDTIILAGVNNKNETITLFSLPRDLWVEYPDSTLSWKINRIYETYVPESRELAINKLKQKVTEITWKEIDYYMNLDFEGFIEVVDILWWVEVTLEENFVDYEYPAGPGRYKTFILRKWTWTLDWEVALMYARSRHSTSDFDRSLRQQEIISSLKTKVWNLGYFKNSKTIFDLYWVFKDYVETDMAVWDMISIGLKIKWWENSKTLSFNLNDSCFEWSPTCSSGGFLYVPLREYFGGASVLLPNKSIAVKPWYYDDIQDFTDLIYDNSHIYKNPVSINIHNASRVPWLAASFASSIIPYGIQINTDTDLQTLSNPWLTKSTIYYNGIDRDNSTLNYLESVGNFDIIQSEIPKYSSSDTRIEVILVEKSSF